MTNLTTLIREAKELGYSKRQRHEIAEVYREAATEFLRITNPHMEELYERRLQLHACIKAVGYMTRHEPERELK